MSAPFTSNNKMVDRFLGLRAWSRGEQRAIHKPLLVLYAIGVASRSRKRLIPYRQVNHDLGALLKEFGPPRRTIHTEYPFWRLQHDGIWEVENAGELRRRASNSDPIKSELIAHDIHGGFNADVFAVLRRSASTREKIVRSLLSAHFPRTLHGDILASVGLSPTFEHAALQTRSQDFRKQVLRVYNYSCCVCGYNLRLGTQSIGLEAAHIKWYQAGGPDEVQNGLALCVLHHKLFDLGAFTVDPTRSLVICSEELSNSSRSDWILGFHGENVAPPLHPDYAPKAGYFTWHRTQVFRAPGRALRRTVT